MRIVCPILFCVWMAACSEASATVDTVRLGDDKEAVYSLLGKAKGYVAYGSKESLFYERGRLELTDGRVTMVDLISQEELEGLRAQQDAEIRRAQLAEQERQARLFAEGAAVLERKLADEAFMSAPAEARVSYWRAFQKRYPHVPIGDSYGVALQELEADLAYQAQAAYEEERLAALEHRVRDAEERAYRAELDAREARRRESHYYVASVYGVPYYTPAAHVPRTTHTYYQSTRSHRTSLSPSFVRKARHASRPNVRAHRYSGSPHVKSEAH